MLAKEDVLLFVKLVDLYNREQCHERVMFEAARQHVSQPTDVTFR